MENLMQNLYNYILAEFPSTFMTFYAIELLANVLVESEKIKSISERCNWLSRMLPQMSLSEIRDILLR